MTTKIAAALSFVLATVTLAADTNAPAIIPAPQKLERSIGVFRLGPETHIYVDFASRATGRYLAERLRKSTGYPFRVSARFRSSVAAKDSILLTTAKAKANLGTEGYELTVVPDSVVIRAPKEAGAFYGVQSLLQLLPPEVFASNTVANVNWQIPCVQIEDRPRFKWRGLMLDVSRHFFDKDEIKRLLDEMALHKLNTFHWHLVDDHGWRIEIKKYPRLTQVGAWRDSVGFGLATNSTTAYGADGRYGGFYTQKDIREVVAYASARHITIVPEIETPGHSTAALAVYPQLSCSGGPFTMPSKGGIFRGIYCTGNDETYQLVQNVLKEVFQLFPGKFVHIGGDEVPTNNWAACPKDRAVIQREGLKDASELEGYFIRRLEKFINARGRTLIGWSEIREGGLAPSAVVMDWKGGGAEAAGAGHDVVMSPTKFCYLDYYQSQDRSTEPRAIGNFVPLNRVYTFEPIPAKLAPELQSHILGGQCNLWTEYVPSLSHAEYMIFPRACALAEVTWSPKDARDWEDFMRRLQVHARRLEQLGVNYRHAGVTTPEKNPFQ